MKESRTYYHRNLPHWHPPGAAIFLTKRIKGYTAREANAMLQRTGEHFWQQESFDHWPGDDDEFFRIIGYIENNPVKAGLVQRPEEWRWSSAAERKRRGWTEIRALT